MSAIFRRVSYKLKADYDMIDTLYRRMTTRVARRLVDSVVMAPGPEGDASSLLAAKVTILNDRNQTSLNGYYSAWGGKYYNRYAPEKGQDS